MEYLKTVTVFFEEAIHRPLSFIILMRFILIYKYGFFQRRTERLDVANCASTNQIIEMLARKLQKSQNELIIRAKKDKQLFRIVKGWPIQHYELQENTQLNIQTFEQQQQEVLVSNSKNKYLENLLGTVLPSTPSRQELQKISEEEQLNSTSFAESQAGAIKKSFNVRKYLDGEVEKLLKEIQKGRIEQVKKMLDQAELPKDLDQDSLLEVEVLRSNLINQLGEGGWGAIHYAIYCNRVDIVEELLHRHVQLNRCTADSWLPLMIAVNRKNTQIMKMLLAVKNLNVNEVTAKGTALHTASKLGFVDGVKLLMDRDADPKITDQKGRNSEEVAANQTILTLLKRDKQAMEQRRLSGQKALPFIPPTLSAIRGRLYRVSSILFSHSQRFAVLDPYEGTFIHYESQATFPKRPLEVVPIISIRSVKMIKQKAWRMKSDHSYFEIYIPQREILVVRHKKIAEAWVRGIFDAIIFTTQAEKHKNLRESIPRKLRVLDDTKGIVIGNEEEPKQQVKLKTEKGSNPPLLKKDSIFKKPTGSMSDSGMGNSGLMTSSGLITSSGLMSSSNMMDASQMIMPPQLQNKSFREELQKPLKSESNTSTEPTSEVAEQKSIENQKDLTESLQMLTNDGRITFGSFEIIKTLGSGAFGKVFLAKHIASKKFYALKALKKKTLIVKKQLKYAISEANVLKKANHPFIINLHYAFQTPNFLYLALDYCPGRDLSHHLAREVTFREDQARFYIAQLILAIEHLHQKNIIYRDMKPENILIDGQGHIKLADFGLSKDNVEDKTKSFCGSPAYLSPEMLNQKGVSKQADLYGIGCVLYQFLVGEPPYYSDEIPELYKNIKEAKLKFPKGISEEAKSLISGLLQREPKKRLGSQNFNQIFDHPFFRGLNWDDLLNKRIPPPVRAQHNSEDDAEQEDEDMKMLKSNKNNFTDNDYQDSDKKINRLINFSFVRATQ